MYSKQKLYCCICAKEFLTSVSNSGGYFSQGCCSRDCMDEKQWRETLSIMGHEYTPAAKKKEEHI